MLGFPVSCNVGRTVDLKRHISSMSAKPAEKRKFRECAAEIVIDCVVNDSVLPGFVDGGFKVLAVQFLSVKVISMKYAAFVSGVLQRAVKSFAVIRIFDGRYEAYSFALKRLNMQDSEEVVISDEFLTPSVSCGISDSWDNFADMLVSFDSVVNKTSLFSCYAEIMVRSFIFSNKVVWSGMDTLLSCDVWYNTDEVLCMFEDLKRLVSVSEKRADSLTMGESLNLNAELKRLYKKLSGYF